MEARFNGETISTSKKLGVYVDNFLYAKKREVSLEDLQRLYKEFVDNEDRYFISKRMNILLYRFKVLRMLNNVGIYDKSGFINVKKELLEDGIYFVMNSDHEFIISKSDYMGSESDGLEEFNKIAEATHRYDIISAIAKANSSMIKEKDICHKRMSLYKRNLKELKGLIDDVADRRITVVYEMKDKVLYFWAKNISDSFMYKIDLGVNLKKLYSEENIVIKTKSELQQFIDSFQRISEDKSDIFEDEIQKIFEKFEDGMEFSIM